MGDDEIKNIDRIKKVGLKIAYYRNLRELSQEELASMVFLSREQINRIESPNGKSFTSVDTLFCIADALEIDIRRLFDFE